MVLTTNQTADRLGVSSRTVQRLIRSNVLDIIHVGRAVRISENVLSAYIESGGSNGNGGNGRKKKRRAVAVEIPKPRTEPAPRPAPVRLANFDADLDSLRRKLLEKPSHRNQYSKR